MPQAMKILDAKALMDKERFWHTSGEPQHLACCLETLTVCTVAESVMAGAAVRKRQRFLRSMWRHEQLSLKMMTTSMSHHSWQSRESVRVQTLILLPRPTYFSDRVCGTRTSCDV